MNVNIHKLYKSDIPEQLRNLDQRPNVLYFQGSSFDSWIDMPKLGVVGSRKMSSYGFLVTESLTSAAAKAGIVIISGLAYGVDAAAHRAALNAGATTVAILPTSLNKIYPASHNGLATQILANGTLISEYGPEDPVFKVNFTNRNRLIAGLCDALLITEAALRSGSLHTARFALEQGKTVMAVPGNINNPGSEGCNNLIKSGAIPVTSPQDIFLAMGIVIKPKDVRTPRGNKHEQAIYKLISEGVSDQDELMLNARLDVRDLNSVLTGLEINGYIKALGAGRWTITA